MENEDMTVLNEVEDAKCVYQYAAGLPFVDRERIAMLGASQGGVVTSMAVGELGSTKIKAAVLMCPAAVLRDDCIKGLLMGKRYDPLDPPEVVQVGDKCIGREFIKTTFRLPIYETAANSKAVPASFMAQVTARLHILMVFAIIKYGLTASIMSSMATTIVLILNHRRQFR